MRELFDRKAETADGARGLAIIGGGAPAWRPMQTLLRAFSPVRNPGRRDENRRQL